MLREWRLLIDGETDGAVNMALDRALQLAREAGEAPATLRLYRWRVPTVSLGRFQAIDGVDMGACAELGIDLVRRPSGGRAVLHDDELTYSLAASVSDGIPRGVTASYRHIAAALSCAFSEMGVDAEITRKNASASSSASCYLVNTRADLSYRGGKLSGSAQVWHGSTVLQHGSFVRARDVSREARIFRLSDAQSGALARHAMTIEDVTGEKPDLERMIDVVARSFEQTLGLTLRLKELTQSEMRAAVEAAHAFRVRRPQP